MLKIVFYTSLTLVGLVWALGNPVVGAIACIEAYFLNPITVVKDAPISRYQLYTAICFVIGVVCTAARQLPAVHREGAVVKALWAYGILAVCSAIWAHASAQEAFEHGLDFCKTVLIAWLLLFAVRSERGLRAIFLAIVIGSLHAAFMHTEGVDLDWISKRWSDEWGVMPDMQGSVMVTILPCFILIAMYGSSWWEKALGWVGMPLVVNSIVETYQRSYFVALATQTMLLLLFLPKRVALRLVPVLGAGAILFVFVLTPEEYWGWIYTISDPTQEASANSRFIIYKSTFECLADNPVLGVGYRNFHLVSHNYLPDNFLETAGAKAEHSTFASVYTQVGLVGFAIWSIAVGSALLCLRRVRKASNTRALRPTEIYAMAFELGLYGWLAGGVFHSDHESDPAYWMIILAVAIYRIRFKPVSRPQNIGVPLQPNLLGRAR